MQGQDRPSQITAAWEGLHIHGQQGQKPSDPDELEKPSGKSNLARTAGNN